MPKRIALVYCGGCNEAYSRVDMARDIKDALGALPEGAPQWVGPNQPADMRLVLCGCMALCIAHKAQEAPAGICHVIGPDSLDYADCPQPQIMERIKVELKSA